MKRKARLPFFFLGICFCLIFQPGAAKTYYFSNQGNDSYTRDQAQHINSPWKSLAKLQSLMYWLRPGDSVKFRRGDIFYGSIHVGRKYGNRSKLITFCAYGTGAAPVISGFINHLDWKYSGNHIYRAHLDRGPKVLNMVAINKLSTPMGRYPNHQYLTYEIAGNDILLRTLHAAIQEDWTGAELVIRKERYIVDRCPVTHQNRNKLSYRPMSPFKGHSNYGCFIQNKLNTLDTLGEWYYDKPTKTLSVYNDQSAFIDKVQASHIDTVVEVTNSAGISFNDLLFEGANAINMNISNSQNITLNKCSFNFSGVDAIKGDHCSHIYIIECQINNSNSNGIVLDQSCSYSSVLSSTLENTFLYPGMGGSGYGNGNAMMVFGAHSAVRFNSIIRSGGGGISFGGDYTTIEHNLIDSFTFIKDDGGGIYSTFPAEGQKIIGNIILNGLAAPNGSDNPQFRPSYGIYADLGARNIEIAYNTVAFCAESGIMLHNTPGINIHNNTCYNNGLSQVQLNRDIAVDELRDVRLGHNLLVAGTSAQCGLLYRNLVNSFSGLIFSNGNTFVGPASGDGSIELIVSGVSNCRIAVSEWDKISGDNGSNTYKPLYIVGGKIFFFYNPTKSGKKIRLSEPCTDLSGTSFQKEIALKPYTSVILRASR